MRMTTTISPRHYLLAASGLCLALTACSSDPDVTPEPAGQDASSEVATGGSTLVKDVTWIVGDPPASWEELEVGDGQSQWQVRDECLFTLDQPAGIDADKVPVEQVLVDTETKIEGQLGFELDPGPVTTESFPVQSSGEGITSADVVTLDYTSAAGATGSIYAYREGEYALIIYTACSANVPFEEVDEQDFAPFIDEQLSINLEY